MAKIEEYDIENPFQATVLESTRITPEEADEEVREIVFEADKSDFQFQIGQSVAVIVPGPHAFGNRQHVRLYTIANTLQEAGSARPTIRICVKRCSYVDEYSGERYQGVASNFLCDLRPGDTVTLAGPYGLPFEVPDDDHANLLMIGLGTGIAPFRAFVRHIYETVGGWKGKVRLFYGARSGLELLYLNDRRNDFANYYDEETFKAFDAVSPRPHLDDPVPLEDTLYENEEEVWTLLRSPDTYVYVAGLEAILEKMDKALTQIAGSEEKWQRRKAELIAGKRWAELIY